MNLQELEGEAVGASSPSVIADAAANAGTASVSDRITLLIVTAGIAAFAWIAAIAMRRKKEAGGVEDAAWAISNKTMKRLEATNETLQKELDLVRMQRNEFEATAIRAEANARVAAQAAAVSAEAAVSNAREIERMQRKSERDDRYIRILRTALVAGGIDIPPEPAL